MPDPTPGQAAYVTWWRTKYGMQQADPASAYQLLPAADRRAWEAAAQAVLDAARTTPVGEEEPHGT